MIKKPSKTNQNPKIETKLKNIPNIQIRSELSNKWNHVQIWLNTLKEENWTWKLWQYLINCLKPNYLESKVIKIK